ncbi:OLC1v1020111C2 [Oldenlandia corymbosa var. corymbosa]|nr:OLC1v1020111C2 [Oldenlandia corymbosa var. corymbosa]
MSATAREVIRKYLKKVKPLYEKLSQKQQLRNGKMSSSTTDVTFRSKKDRFFKDSDQHNYFPLLQSSGNKGGGERESNNNGGGGFSHSFSGNLRYPRRSGRSYVSSCPSSMRSSPSHSGVLCTKKSGSVTPPGKSSGGGLTSYGSGSYDASSMEELQNAIQGAIAHCKNSMLQNNKGIMVSDEI